uniref:G2/M phase-specific E3 ubiquitin-protein ligase n=1 Tax=Timema poppense TaxID=170557 RepID=A0A7R9D1X4_TIMPO|nr:unnamed protein product [Timema poppensis]
MLRFSVDSTLKTMADSGACRSCIFCQQASDIEQLTQEEDILTHGVVHTRDGITTHYFCLLLASLMEQNGKDNEGILGFLPKDILTLVDKSKRNVCTYCKQPGATIYCVSRNCKSIFHLPCGTKRGSTHHFFETFRSFCPTHRPKPILKPVFEIEPDRDENGHVVCIICFDSILRYENKNIVKAPCCGYRSWFHKLCIQKLAVSFGYFFKCPLCNDIDKFYKAMLHYGIFIPEQDASWELAPNAFMELLERPDECSKEHCLCPKGKKHNVDGTIVSHKLLETKQKQSTYLLYRHHQRPARLHDYKHERPIRTLIRTTRHPGILRAAPIPTLCNDFPAAKIFSEKEETLHLCPSLPRWELLLCNLCGHKARHKHCLNRTGPNDVYECKDCTTPSLEPASIVWCSAEGLVLNQPLKLRRASRRELVHHRDTSYVARLQCAWSRADQGRRTVLNVLFQYLCSDNKP